MSDQQTPEQKQTTLTREGLDALYRELGERTHVVHELNAQLVQSKAREQEAMRLLAEAKALYGPKADDDQAPATSEIVDGEVVPIDRRKKGSG